LRAFHSAWQSQPTGAADLRDDVRRDWRDWEDVTVRAYEAIQSDASEWKLDSPITMGELLKMLHRFRTQDCTLEMS